MSSLGGWVKKVPLLAKIDGRYLGWSKFIFIYIMFGAGEIIYVKMISKHLTG